MSFLVDLYNKLHPAPKTEQYSTPETKELSARALEKADGDYILVQEKEHRVALVASQLRAQRERNHFAELIERTMRGVG